MPVPSRKAVLLTAENASIKSLAGNPEDALDKAWSPDMRKLIATRLVPYDGAPARDLNIPPVLSAYLNMVRPDAALSPDGNLAAVTLMNIFSNMNEPDAEWPKPTTIPAIVDLDRGALRYIITKPVDNALAGLFSFRLGDQAAARPYLEALPESLWGASDLTRTAAFTLFAAQRRSGDHDRARRTYDAILAFLGEDDPHLAFVEGYYSALAGAGLSYQDAGLVSLPDFGALLTDADRELLKAELDAAAAAGAWKTDFLLGAWPRTTRAGPTPPLCLKARPASAPPRPRNPRGPRFASTCSWPRLMTRPDSMKKPWPATKTAARPCATWRLTPRPCSKNSAGSPMPPTRTLSSSAPCAAISKP